MTRSIQDPGSGSGTGNDMTPKKKLTRSRDDRMIAGVCGGLAEYFQVDPTLVRIIYVIGSLLSAAFPGTLAYIILWVVMPDEPHRLEEPHR